MIYLLDVEVAKTFAFVTIALLVAIPVAIYLVYINGVNKRKKRQG